MNRRGSLYSIDAYGPKVLSWLKRYRYWIVAPAVLLLAALGWWLAPFLRAVINDPSAVQTFVLQLGWFGPFALVALNALQIVVAPIPGYVVQVAAGYLYGPVWGGLWGSLGLLIGATLAFWLARIFGRPLAEKLVGRSRLDKWETVTHSTSAVVWFLLLLGPTGDVPYFLAGLSRVGFLKILLITIVLRVPAVYLAAAAGAMTLPWWQLGLIYTTLAAIAAGSLLYQNRLRQWMENRAGRPLTNELLPVDLNQDSP